jgi:amidase
MNLHYLGLLEVADLIRRRTVTSEEVTRQLLARIERNEGRLNSIALLLAESALEEARRADAEIAAGFHRSRLHGVPIGVKDLLWSEGLPTAAGTKVLADFRPPADATVVKRLKQAGAVIIAKLQMTEGATVHHHPDVARPENPWAADRWTGVSSSGSGVATAAGFCFGSIGSDTGGSIRMPSSANNLTGIKPTWGRVSRHGLVHLSESLDHLGPMARSTEDAAAILQVIAGADSLDPTALTDPTPDYLACRERGVGDLVLGIDWDFAVGGMPDEIVQCLHDALAVFQELGVRVRTITLPWTEAEFAETLPIFDAEVLAAHAGHFPGKAEDYGPWLRTMLHDASANVDRATLARAYMARDRYKGRMRALFRDVDLILTPALGQLLPTWREIESRSYAEGPFNPDLVRFTLPFNVAGTPALSFPGGFAAPGLPIGLQLVAPWLGEGTLISAGAAFQQATAFHTRHPVLD